MQQQNNIIKFLKSQYIIGVTSLALYFALVFFRVIKLGTGEMVLSYSTEVYAIMFTLIVIPISLKRFYSTLKKIPCPSEKSVVEETYKRAFLWRLYPLCIATLMNIMFFGLTRNVVAEEGHNMAWFGVNNFFWFSLLMFIVFIFCKVSEEELERLIEATSGTSSAVETRHAPSPQDENDENIMWWEKGKEEK
jgi:hypothetical protein